MCGITYLQFGEFIINILKRVFGLVLVTVVLSAVTFSTNAHAQTPPDIESFFLTPEHGGLAVSPSGKFLAFPDYSNRHHELVIFNLKTKSEVKRVDMNSRKLNWVKWATEDRLLIGVTYYIRGYIKEQGKKRDADGTISALQRVNMHRVMALDRDGGNRIFLFDKAKQSMQRYVGLAEIEDTLPSDPGHILMPAYDKKYGLWKVNIKTGDLKKVESGTARTYDWKTNHEGIAVVRYDSFKKGKIIKIFVRTPGQKEWQPLVKVRTEDLDTFNPIGPTKDPSIYYVSARPTSSDKVGIFRYDLKAKKFLDQISSHDRVDLHNALIDDGGSYYGSVYYNDRYTYDFLDDDLNDHMTGLNTFFGNEYNILVKDVSVNGLIWILYVSGPRDPGSYYAYSTKTRKAEFLLSDNYELEEKNLNKMEIVNYTSRDGVKLSGYLTVPAQPQSRPAPLLVLPHGGPQARDYYVYDRMVQYLASSGYQVFQPNFRGSRGFGQKFEQAGYKEWGGIMQDDVTDGVQHLIKNGKVNKGRICIMGLSYGGFSALSGAVKTPDLYQCAISINGVSDLSELIKYDLKRFKGSDGLEKFVKDTIGDLKSDKGMIKARSPINNIDKIKIPILVIHGNSDEVVPVSQSQAFVKAMKKANKDINYIEFPDIDHNLLNGRNEDIQSDTYYDAYKETLLSAEEFLAEHLKP